jgi:hypothetical protein
MHSFLKHQAPKSPTHVHEDPEIKATYEYAYEEAPGIAFMITQVMKAELDELGYTPEQIDELTPAETRRILRGKRKDAN